MLDSEKSKSKADKSNKTLMTTGCLQQAIEDARYPARLIHSCSSNVYHCRENSKRQNEALTTKTMSVRSRLILENKKDTFLIDLA